MSNIQSPRRSTLLAVLACAAVLAFSSTQVAAEVTLPTGLSLGSSYQLAFVTSGQTNATNTNIQDYNAFVTAQALTSTCSTIRNATWKVIGSTAATNAIDNAPTYLSIPIYNTNGQRVASGSAALWSGTLDNSIGYNQNGDPFLTSVYTGTWYWGTEANISCLGNIYAEFGYSGATDTNWIQAGYTVTPSSVLPFYALSAPITVSPEPATVSLLATALLGLGVTLIVGRRRGAKR